MKKRLLRVLSALLLTAAAGSITPAVAQTYLISDPTAVTTCSGTIYDSGGPAGSYGNSENFTKTLRPTTTGSMVRLVFSELGVETCCDRLTIYDGVNTSAPLIGSYSANPGTITANNAAGALTLVFTSDGSVTSTGFAAAISCYTPPPPTIAGFAPAGGPTGTNVTVTGANFTSTTAVSFNNVAAPGFVVANGGTQLTVPVPSGNTTGRIRITTPLGTATSASDFTRMAITNFSPATGVPGTSVTITGAGFTNTTSVTFNGLAATFSNVTATSLTAVVPANASAGPITITTTAGTVTSTQNFSPINYLISDPAPLATCLGTLYDSGGPAGTYGNGENLVKTLSPGTPGTMVRLVFSELGVETCCDRLTIYNGANTNAPLIGSYSSNPGTVTATNPSGQLTLVFTSDGSVTGSGFAAAISCYTPPPPTITSFTPAIGITGASVTVTGTNLGGATAVSFNNIAASGFVTSVDGTQLTVPVPPGNTTGRIRITTAQGTATSATDFTWLSLTSFTPTTGVPGMSVTITGTGLTNTTSVTFNGLPATFSNVTATSLTAVVPANVTTGPITIISGGATITSTQNFTPINYLISDPAPLATCVGTLYDSGGPTGAYGNGENLVKTLSPGTPGNLVRLTFSEFSLETCCDRLTIYDGATTSAPLIGSFANNPGTVTATNPAGQLTLVFTSDGSVVGNFAAAISCVPNPLAPTISGFSPTSGPANTSVTIMGTNFTSASAVLFNGVSAPFLVNSATSITATVPAGATTGAVQVVHPISTATSAINFTVTGPTTPPTITSFTPASGAPGSTVTITGTAFSGATTVKFNNVVATSFTVVSPTTITAVVPALATTGKLSVTTGAGTATSTTAFTVAPIVTGFAPAQGAPGSVVLVQGLNFTSTTKAYFNGVLATTTYNSTTQLTAVVPATATTGLVSATNATGTGTSANSYTVVSGAYPTITSFTPTTNVITGTVITITGTNFTGATLVRFNNVSATSFTVNSATSITATVPAGATSGKIYVATASGMGQSATSLTIIAAPTITSLTPTSGAVGSVVLIAGANYSGTTMTAAPVVRFNGVQATTITVNSATQIAAVVPAGATTGKVSVQTVAGTATSAANFVLLAGPAPTITALSPTQGLRGSTVTLTGTNFTGVTSVKLGTVACTYTVNSATQITATVPTTATTNRFYVTTAGGGMAQSPTYTVLLTPTITSFTPTSGPVGQLVTINGTNYAGITAVRFGSVAATSYTVVSTARITATVPAGAVTGQVQVQNAAGTATSAGTFTVTTPPIISSFSPAQGLRGSTVVLTGSRFTGATAVKIGSVAVTTFTVNSDTQLTLTVPTTALTGTISVTTGQGTGASATSYTVLLSPTLTSFTPTSGPVSTQVTLTGTNFTGTTSISFGGVSTSSFTLVSATQLKVNVPTGALTGAIAVTNPAGTASRTTFTVTAARPAALVTAEPLELSLYPNPAREYVEVQVSHLPTATATAVLADPLGRVVRTVAVQEGTTRVSLDGVPAGVYTLRVLNQLRRVVVE